MHKSPITIVGAGIPGLSLAINMARKGLAVTLLEQQDLASISPDDQETRTAALMGRSISWLKACDVWDDIKSQCAPMEALAITNTQDTPQATHIFQSKEIGLKVFGYNCPLGIIRYALLQKARKTKGVALIDSVDIESIEWTQANAIIRCRHVKKPIITPLVIGADGRNSIVRQHAGIDVIEHPYNQAAITAIINHTLPHHNQSHEFHRQGGPLTCVPMPGNQSSLVWVMDKQHAEDVMHYPKQDFEQYLKDQSQAHLGDVTLQTGLSTFPLCRMRAKSITAHRCALIAEAAHTISPIGAQGLNLSIRDAESLLKSIMQARKNGLDIGAQSSLLPYNKQAVCDIQPRVMAVDALHRSVASPDVIIQNLRSKSLTFVTKQPILRRLLMRAGLAA